MSHVILRGDEAVHFAEVHHLTLHCDADETHPGSDEMALEEALEVAYDHPELVWVECDIAINSGEPEE